MKKIKKQKPLVIQFFLFFKELFMGIVDLLLLAYHEFKSFLKLISFMMKNREERRKYLNNLFYSLLSKVNKKLYAFRKSFRTAVQFSLVTIVTALSTLILFDQGVVVTIFTACIAVFFDGYLADIYDRKKEGYKKKGFNNFFSSSLSVLLSYYVFFVIKSYVIFWLGGISHENNILKLWVSAITLPFWAVYGEKLMFIFGFKKNSPGGSSKRVFSFI